MHKEFCEQATRLITDYLSGELDARTFDIFEAHLSQCPDCVSFLETYKEALRVGRSVPCDDIPPEMETRLRELLRERIERGRRKP